MMIPIWIPFVAPFFIAAVVLDKLTNGKVSKSMQRDHDAAVRKQFGWDDETEDKGK